MAEIDKLVQGLGSTRWEARRAASEALVNIGSPAISPLIDALKDNNPDVRWAAIRALGKLGDPSAVKPIIKALRDEDSGVRKTAAEALGKIGDARATVALIAAVDDEDWSVRQAAVESLGKVGQLKGRGCCCQCPPRRILRRPSELQWRLRFRSANQPYPL